jgi:hypothetical protein
VADRRLPCSVKDDGGALRHGELLIARAWRPDLEINPDASFTVVLLQQPPAPDDLTLSMHNVVVCTPAAPIRLPSAVREAPAVSYAGAAPPVPLRLSPTAIEAYGAGRLIALHPLAVTPQEIFRRGETTLSLETLIRALDGARESARRYWEEADRVLAWPDEPAHASHPDRVRSRLRALLERAAASNALPNGAAERLRRIVDGEPPARVVASPAALAEEIASVRCLLDDQRSAEQLAAMQSYLEQAAAGDAHAELAVERAFVREQLSFVTLLHERHRFESLRATFETFRQEYAGAYARHHAAYWQAIARVRASLDDAQAAARALARLNSLRGLGRPVGQPALAAYERLRDMTACAGEALKASLREQPRCPECGITLEDAAPVQETTRALRDLHGALATQQSRLASEAVRRILARGGERLDLFLQIVQASDTAGLAQVLDDELLVFLRDLLAEPVVPTPEALDLFEQLARAYPVIDEAQVDAVIHTLRQLLTEAIATRRAADPSQPSAFRFASPPPS